MNRYFNRNPKAKAISSWDGWAVFFSQLVIAFGFLVFGLTHFAFASPQFRDVGSRAGVETAPSVVASVRGTLSWQNGVGTLQDQNSGRIYTLSHAEGVKALWESGVKNVAVVGKVSGNGSLSVEQVSAPEP